MTLSHWCLLAAAVMPYFVVAIAKIDPDYDNRVPREWSRNLRGYRQRAHAAHCNGLEAFPFFAVAVLLAGSLNAPQSWLSALALAWLALRLVYVGLYLADLATLRSIVWIAAFAVNLAIFTLPAWA